MAGDAVLCSEAQSCVLGVQKMCRRVSNTERYAGWDRALEKSIEKAHVRPVREYVRDGY